MPSVGAGCPPRREGTGGFLTCPGGPVPQPPSLPPWCQGWSGRGGWSGPAFRRRLIALRPALSTGASSGLRWTARPRSSPAREYARPLREDTEGQITREKGETSTLTFGVPEPDRSAAAESARSHSREKGHPCAPTSRSAADRPGCPSAHWSG